MAWFYMVLIGFYMGLSVGWGMQQKINNILKEIDEYIEWLESVDYYKKCTIDGFKLCRATFVDSFYRKGLLGDKKRGISDGD